MKKTIEIKCRGSKLVNYKDIKPFQGELKELSQDNYKKLRGNILRDGFNSALEIWENKGDIFSLDGHQRVKVLEHMEKEGYTIPLIPVTEVFADSHHRAKRILLAHASRYGTVTGQGLYEFSVKNEISPEEIDEISEFKEVNMKEFKKEFFDEFDEPEEKGEPEDKEAKLKECPNCGVVIDG